MKFLIRWLLLVLPMVAAAQSQLPPCPATEYKHNCFGTWTYTNGATYVGEFKDGKSHGQGRFILASGARHVGEWRDNLRNGLGIEYRADGTIVGSGQWAGGKLVQSFALDRGRFPFDHPARTAVPPVNPGRADRDRLAAEDEERRDAELRAQMRQQELKHQRQERQQRTSTSTLQSAIPGTGLAELQSTVVRSGAPSPTYGSLIVRQIRENISFTNPKSEQRTVVVMVHATSDGRITQSKLMVSSGSLLFDAAVQRAVAKMGTVPRDIDGRVPDALVREGLELVVSSESSTRDGEIANSHPTEGRVTVVAQSQLPPCPATGYRHNCFGILLYADGSRYQGEQQDNMPHGRGAMAHIGGIEYVGQWRGGKQHGRGTATWPKGERYVGEWRDGVRSGRGAFTWPDGTKYVGDFQDNKFHGQGIEYRADGVVSRSGTWVDDALTQSLSLDRTRFPFWLISDRLNSGSFRDFPWKERLDRAVQAELIEWLTPDVKGLEEIPPPSYPAALSLKQESWETNKEFEGRVELARAERIRAIDRLQAEYRTRVEERNRRVSEYNKLRQDREAKLVERRRELILMGLGVIAPAATLSEVAFNQQTGDLMITNQMDGLEKQVFSFTGTSQAFRRTVLTDPKAIKASAEFEVTDAGEIVVRALSVEAGGVSARGLPSSSSAAPMQLASVTITSTPAPVIAQQSAVTVDRNQVEQILYREENENLRKRLEDQRRQQEQAVANAEARAAAEIARIRAEADAERKRLSEVRPPQNLVSVQEAHALVIGNSAYAGSNRLANPVNDAKAMSAKLRSMGFRVTEISNANREQMVRGLSEFSKTASKADLTLLFYAGHGVQVQGVNYMVPVDMSLSDPAQATLQAVSLTQVVEQYLPGKTKLVFLDACRDNPLMNSRFRGVARGLAPINVSEGTLISYATKDGQTAEDGVGQPNSPFTAALLEHLSDPEDIGIILRTVRSKVMQRTSNRQQPWEYGSLTGGALVLSSIRRAGR